MQHKQQSKPGLQKAYYRKLQNLYKKTHQEISSKMKTLIDILHSASEKVLTHGRTEARNDNWHLKQLYPTKTTEINYNE